LLQYFWGRARGFEPPN